MGKTFLVNAQFLGAERVGRAKVPPYLAISETEAGEILVEASPKLLDIALESVPYHGSYTLHPAVLVNGPANLVAPSIIGDAVIGQTLTVRSGLWGYDGTGAAPNLSWQWLRDGVAIVGASGQTYVTDPADAGKAISVIETAEDAHGAIQAASTSLAMPAPPSATLVATQRAKANGSSAARVFKEMDLGTPSATRDIVVLAAVFGSAGATITGVNVAGVAATKLVQTLAGGSALLCAGAWLARVPEGDTGDVELLSSWGTTVQHVALFRGESLILADSATAAVGNGSTAAMTIQSGHAGGKVLAFAANNNGTVFDWTGGTELYDEDVQTRKFVSAAFGEVDQDGRASLSASRISGTGQMAGLMIAF